MIRIEKISQRKKRLSLNSSEHTNGVEKSRKQATPNRSKSHSKHVRLVRKSTGLNRSKKDDKNQMINLKSCFVRLDKLDSRPLTQCGYSTPSKRLWPKGIFTTEKFVTKLKTNFIFICVLGTFKETDEVEVVVVENSLRDASCSRENEIEIGENSKNIPSNSMNLTKRSRAKGILSSQLKN